MSSEDAAAQRQGGQVVSVDVLDAQEPGSEQLDTGQPSASTASSAPVPGMCSGVRVVHPPGATLLQMNAPRHVASIFTSGPVFGKSPEGGLVVSLNLSSVSFIQPSLLPLPLLIVVDSRAFFSFFPCNHFINK
jgi:hypothetical protein